jgi:hypothetical protein
MTNYTKNILKTFDLATLDEVNHGLTWYHDAKVACQIMADKYALPLRIVVGVCAALSPTNRWERNLIDTENMLSNFMSGGYVEDTSPCTYKKMRDKAWDILQTNPHNDGDVLFLLKGPKISDFFSCIMGHDVCVIDGHAWCIANADRRTMQDVPSIGKKLRAELQDAYVKAGKKHNMTAYEMQAATWVTWKRLHNA